LAEFQADTVPILIALNADLKIVSIKGERIIPLDQFYSDTGHPSNLLGPSELIEEIRLPLLTKGCRATYERFAVRAGIDFAIVSVAIFLNINQDTHRCQEARIVVSGALPSPFICRKVSAVLQDQKLQDEFIKMTAEEAAREAKPINPTGFSVSYKRHLIEALTRKGLQNLLDIRTG
jgi:CO/xanthine dehydrogenase FAD-binding subunit